MPRVAVSVILASTLVSSLAWGGCAPDASARGQAPSAPHETQAATCPFVAPTALKNALLVDVRSADALARVRIDGAVVAGLADIESRVPRGLAAVLVGTGLDTQSLISACQSLRSRGWSLSVLKGGVQALPPGLRQSTDAMAVFRTTPSEVATRMRMGEGVRLVVADSASDWGVPAESLHEPSVAVIRSITADAGEVVFAGPKPWAEGWIALLRGSGGAHAFWMSEDAVALASAHAAIDAIHQGRHWVPPTPCERQAL